MLAAPFRFGGIQEKIFESLSGENECGKILRARGQTELHVDIGDLVEGIIANIAVWIFVENFLVGLARFFDLPSALESKTEIKLSDWRVDAVWRILQDRLIHLGSLLNPGDARDRHTVAKDHDLFHVQIRVGDENLPRHGALELRRVRIASNQGLISIERRVPAPLDQQDVRNLKLGLRSKL